MYLQQTGTNAVVADSTGNAPLSDTTPNLQAHPAYVTGLFSIVAELPVPYYLLIFASPIQTPQIVTPPALTKGAQGSLGFPVQNLKDAGRTLIIFSVTGASVAATGNEAMATLNRFKQGEGVTSGTSFTPTSGKYFRITQIVFATRGHNTATAQATTFTLRANALGEAINTSTVIFKARCATPATANAWDRVQLQIPDGIEIVGDGVTQIGVSVNSVYTTNAPTGDILIVGFEY